MCPKSCHKSSDWDKKYAKSYATTTVLTKKATFFRDVHPYELVEI